MRKIMIPLLLLLLTVVAGAQQAAIAFCALDQTLDFKAAKPGDKITLHLTRDLVVNEKTLLPRGTALTATIVDAKDGNAVSIVLDKAKLKSGNDVALVGIVAAVAKPSSDLSDDPLMAMNHSAEATMRPENSAMTSLGSSGAAVQTAMQKRESDPKSNLQEDSSGAIGIDGLNLNWLLDKSPATTVMIAKKKNFKLARGTEALLRMAPPQM